MGRAGDQRDENPHALNEMGIPQGWWEHLSASVRILGVGFQVPFVGCFYFDVVVSPFFGSPYPNPRDIRAPFHNIMPPSSLSLSPRYLCSEFAHMSSLCERAIWL